MRWWWAAGLVVLQDLLALTSRIQRTIQVRVMTRMRRWCACEAEGILYLLCLWVHSSWTWDTIGWETNNMYLLPLSFSFCSHNSSKMKPSQSALAHVSILLLTATTYPAACNAKTIVVEPTESIQEALDHASDGDNIHVKPGLYYEGSRWVSTLVVFAEGTL